MTWKILIVEDDAMVQRVTARRSESARFKGKFDLSFAATVADARQLFVSRIDWDAIVLDHNLVNETSESLIPLFRDSFTGPLVAISGSHMQEQVSFGCNHVCEMKSELLPFLEWVLTR